MTITTRLVAWSGGLLIASGIFAAVWSFETWRGAYRYTGGPFLMVAIVIVVAYLVLGGRLTSRAHLSAAAAATWTSALMMGACAANAGFIDMKQPGYRVQMISTLLEIAAAEADFKRDSARFTATPEIYTIRTVTSQVTLTPDGWTATTTHAMLEQTCVIFVGRTSLPPATVEGVPTCTPLPFFPGAYIPALFLILAGAGVAAAANARDRREQALDA